MLKGENIYLRALEPSDADLIFRWENNPSNWKISGTLLPFSKHLIEQYVNSAQDIYSVKQLRFIIESNHKKPLGTIDLFDFDPINNRAGVGILIADSEERGKGYAKEALKLLIDYTFNHLSMRSLFCNILEDNKISLNLFESCGFEIVGLKKDWIKTPRGYQNEFLLQLINA